MKIFFIFVFLTSGCALFRPSASIDDPLLNFYTKTPPAHTQAALRLTEKAREEIHAGKQPIATEHLEKALTIDPQCSFAYYFLALSAHQNGDYKKSNGFLEKAKQLFSSFPFWRAQSYYLSGQNFEKLNNEKMAQAQFKKAREIDSNL
ncbi:MAG: hypothetical protein HYW85_07395 [Deltaproteobacteria bacterium]|nr:hypothetical protein [Deltaproteobacteria bacterium]